MSNSLVNIQNDKIRGSLIGGAIGDALGYQIEFSKGIKEKQIKKYSNDYGIISDDTQMTLFTANSLIWRETRGSLRGIAMKQSDAIYLGYLDWLETQQSNYKNESPVTWIKKIRELNVRRNPGNTCIGALMSEKKGSIDNPINNSKGCGTIMRIAPIGLYSISPEIAGMCAAESSALTHGHPLGIIPAYVASVLINIITNSNKTIEQSLKEAIDIYNKSFDIYNKKYKDYFINLINKAIKLSKASTSDTIAIKELGEGWVADEAFAIAIYSCLKYSKSIEKTIICAVNHDGDSDSTGAIAGNIIGAYLGYSKIPKYYIENLELKDIILEIADDLSIKIPVTEYANNNNQYWLSKYSFCDRDLTLKKN